MNAQTVAWGATAILYALSGGLSFASLWRGDTRAQPWAARSLAAALLAHFTFIGITCSTGRTPFDGIHSSLSATAFLLSVAYLFTMRRQRLVMLGAFVMPVSLIMVLASGFGEEVATVSDDLRAAMLPWHITVNVLGIVAFTLAFAVAVAYLIQEHKLRQRELTGVFRRLPALDVLDSLGLRLITVGFPLFTLGVVSGTLWAVRMGSARATLSPAHGFALLAWMSFGGVLFARAAAGWRGRRAAFGTMFGFGCTIAAMAGYMLRSTG